MLPAIAFAEDFGIHALYRLTREEAIRSARYIASFSPTLSVSEFHRRCE
jgi:hypothetical protein